MTSLKRLAAYSVFGGICCLGIGLLNKNEISKSIIDSYISKEVLKTLREHEGAMQLLGEPVECKRARFGNIGLYFSDHSAVEMQVSGSKSDGEIFFTIVEDEAKKPKVESIQLQLGSDKTRRLVIKESESQKTV